MAHKLANGLCVLFIHHFNYLLIGLLTWFLAFFPPLSFSLLLNLFSIKFCYVFIFSFPVGRLASSAQMVIRGTCVTVLQDGFRGGGSGVSQQEG